MKSVSVTLDAAELQAYLDALPRLLTENLFITAAGELGTAVELKNFYGPGHITLSGSGLVMRNSIRCTYCSVPIYVYNAELHEQTGGGPPLEITNCAFVYVEGCIFIGLGAESLRAAVFATDASVVRLRGIQALGCYTAVEACRGSVITFDDADGENPYQFNDNANGAFTWAGGIILLGSGVPDTLGGSTNKKYGGIIAKADGTLL